MSSLLTVVVSREADVVLVEASGEMDMSNVEELEAALAANRVPGATIVLDLAGLTFMDSTGIRLLLRADAAARSEGHLLELRALSKAVLRALEVAGVLDRLPVAPEGAARGLTA